MGGDSQSKALSKAIKSKGLGRLRWYCTPCGKQCRDENGFQAHCKSEPHLRKIIALGPNAGSAVAEYSRQFQYEFVTLLRTRHNTQRVRANAVYNEYIQDKEHVHMNATRWVTLSGFIMTLGKAGIVKVDEDDKGLWIQWVDNTPATLAKQAAAQKKERSTMDGEERERKMIEDQIARARAAAGADEEGKGLERDGEKVTISLKPETNEGATKISIGAIGASKTESKPFSMSINPLKRAAPTNVFKSAKAPKTEEAPRPKAFMSEAERLMKEDQARKAARQGQGGYRGAGPRR